MLSLANIQWQQHTHLNLDLNFNPTFSLQCFLYNNTFPVSLFLFLNFFSAFLSPESTFFRQIIL